ncbi:hypothetical protein [Diaphorobacter nitroreducens]|uniref:hypothetical protein n=1 Tax=Diaphorobacter nitroreducens TaxID=164759 RepID=UPI002897B26F|nr:hypothetical protein [Diaphorobacter nitroreducens]
MEWGEFFVQAALSALGAGLGAYGVIRAELARVGTLAKLAYESAEAAHRRIDGMLHK